MLVFIHGGAFVVGSGGAPSTTAVGLAATMIKSSSRSITASARSASLCLGEFGDGGRRARPGRSIGGGARLGGQGGH